jgi:hypothetical protein
MTIAAGQPMLASDINNLTFFPIGTILQFSGSEYSNLTSARTADNKIIWTLCNGTNVNGITVPNLVDKFLRGAASSGSGKNCADSQNIILKETNLPAHKHASGGLSVSNLSLSGLTAQSAGKHRHAFSFAQQVPSTGGTGAYLAGYESYSGNASNSSIGVYSSSTCSATSSVVADGDHTHTVSGSISGGSITGSTDNAGSGAAFTVNTVPVYYAVVYLIKVA